MLIPGGRLLLRHVVPQPHCPHHRLDQSLGRYHFSSTQGNGQKSRSQKMLEEKYRFNKYSPKHTNMSAL